MSKKTRINRPTTATPRKDPRPPRYLFISTHFEEVKGPDGVVRVIKRAPGETAVRRTDRETASNE